MILCHNYRFLILIVLADVVQIIHRSSAFFHPDCYAPEHFYLFERKDVKCKSSSMYGEHISPPVRAASTHIAWRLGYKLGDNLGYKSIPWHSIPIDIDTIHGVCSPRA